MVQVTMSGEEYQAFLKAAERLAEVKESLRQAQRMEFEVTTNKYTPSDYVYINCVDKPVYPEHLSTFLIQSMVEQLLSLGDETFKLWVRSGRYAYSPEERAFSDLYWLAPSYTNLLEVSQELREKVEARRPQEVKTAPEPEPEPEALVTKVTSDEDFTF